MKKILLLAILILAALPAMADNEIWFVSDFTGETALKAVIDNPPTGLVFDANEANNEWGTYEAVAITDRAITVTEHANIPGCYLATPPSGLGAGTYLISIFDSVDGTLSAGDTVFDGKRFIFPWSGVIESTLATARVTDFGTTTADTLTLGNIVVSYDGAQPGMYIGSSGDNAITLESSAGSSIYSAQDISIGGVTLTELAALADDWVGGGGGGIYGP